MACPTLTLVIKYHGTPISGPADQAARFLHRRHALVSFEAPQHLSIVQEQCESYIIDSGVFTIWQRGGNFDYWGYEKFVRNQHKHPRFSWCLIPDVIDGDELINDVYLYGWPSDLPGVPVWHLHESLDRLVRLCSEWGTVALGSSGQYRTPGARIWWRRIGEAMDAICDEHGRPPCKLHGLRMLSPNIFTKLPFASADSANVAINTGSRKRFGTYDPPSAAVRASMIADRIEAHNSAAVWERRS
jgi:hypothetical protein